MTLDFPALPRRCAASLLVLSVLASCVSVPKRDIADECARYRQPFEQGANTWNDKIRNWAVRGAFTGLIIGSVIAITGNRNALEKVLASVIVGAAGGALLGYLSELRSRANTKEGLRAAVEGDSSATATEIERMRVSLEKLNACRVRQIRSLKQLVTAQELSRSSARARLEKIRRWVAEDSRLVADVTGLTEQQTRIYMGAYASVTEPGQLDAVAAEWENYQPTVRGGQVTSADFRSSGEVAYATTSVRLRAGPGTQHRILGMVPPGGEVEVLGRRAGWTKVRYRGREGFVSSEYLSRTRPNAVASTVELPAVEARSRRIGDPIRKVAYAQKELVVESEAQKEVVDREIADLELLLRTQAWTPLIMLRGA